MRQDFAELEEQLILKSQDEWAEYADPIFSPKIKWKRFSESGKRFYWSPILKENSLEAEEIIFGVGITTAISRSFSEPFALKEWKSKTPNWERVLKDSSEYGTLMHIVINEYIRSGTLNQNRFEFAEYKWSKGDQLRRDILSFIKFKNDFQLEPMLMEGILSADPYEVPGTNVKVYLCTAIDSVFKATIPVKKKRLVDTEEVYLRGPRKGEKKQVEESYMDYITKYAIVDYKSNFADKAKKTFFDSHRQQLLFGKHVFCKEFGIPEEDVLIYNWSPNGWETEPTYTITEHTEKKNSLGFTDTQILGQKLMAAFMNNDLSVQGEITQFTESFGTTDVYGSYIILTYEEYIRKNYFAEDIIARRAKIAEEAAKLQADQEAEATSVEVVEE